MYCLIKIKQQSAIFLFLLFFCCCRTTNYSEHGQESKPIGAVIEYEVGIDTSVIDRQSDSCDIFKEIQQSIVDLKDVKDFVQTGKHAEIKSDSLKNHKKQQLTTISKNEAYIEYFPTGKQWEIYSDCLRPYSITIIGDTLINEKSYKKIESRRKNSQKRQDLELSIYDGIYYYIRQEGKKVYMLANKYYNKITKREEIGNYEYLLYDFTLNVGDTLLIPNYYDNVLKPGRIVAKVGFVKLKDGRQAKRIWYKDNTFDTEYIGHNQGFFQNVLSGDWLGCAMGREVLVKCMEDDKILYEFENTNACFPKDIFWTIKTNETQKKQSIRDTIELGRYYSLVDNVKLRCLGNKIFVMIFKCEDEGEPCARCEYLLYDFSLQKGDSILDNVWNDNKYVYVDSVATTTLFDGRKARMIFYKDSQRESDIKFIGNIHGVTWPAEQHNNTVPPDTLLNCMVGDRIIWSNNKLQIKQ